MKKTLLALAVSALSVNAFAVNLDTAAGTQVFAQEIKIAAAGTDIGAAAVTATVNAGFSLPAGFVRFDLTNGAKFKDAPVLTGVANTLAAGGAGQSFAIFNFTAPVTATPATPLTLTSTNGITVVNKAAVGISYGLYETAGNATTQTGNLNAKSGTLLSFTPALTVTATPAPAALKIDAIGAESKKFAGNATSTPLTTLTAALVATPPLKIDGTPVTAVTEIASTAAWKLNGNFSAVAVNGLNAAAGGAATIAADKQSVTYAANAASPALVTYTVTGTTEIAETGVSAVFTPTAAAGYEDVAPVTIANAGKLEKNGTTLPVDLALKPGGAYSNYVRISNKDTIPGAFFIKVINDAGQAVSFPLSDVAGQPATIAAGASTTQLSIQSIFDAAAAKGLALSGEGKLRLEVTGQTNNLSVQSYTIAKDGNSFATF